MDAYTEKLLTAGSALLDKGDATRALRLFRRALQRHPDDAQLLLRLARQCAGRGALTEARGLYADLAALFDAEQQPGKAGQVRERMQEIDAVLSAQQSTPRAVKAGSTRTGRKRLGRRTAPAGRATPGFLAFALGACCVLLPLSSPEVAAALEEVHEAQPSSYVLDGRTRLGLESTRR